jgi:hypothetical protein
MMRICSCFLISLFTFTTVFSAVGLPVNGDTTFLPKPDLSKGKPLMQLLKERKSSRSFSDRKIELTTLSDILWAANGINRDDGKRTSPAAMNVQVVDIYAVMPDAVYLYNAEKHCLIKVSDSDVRKNTGKQDFVFSAPLNLVYIVNLSKYSKLPSGLTNTSLETMLQWAYISAGAQSQNVNLYCASEGLGAVVRTSIDASEFGKVLKLPEDQIAILAQTIGFIK